MAYDADHIKEILTNLETMRAEIGEVLMRLRSNLQEPQYHQWAENHKRDSDYLMELDVLQRIYGFQYDFHRIEPRAGLEQSLIGK
jgi:hypothetical protein